MKNLYEILDVEKTASQQDIKNAYFKLAKKYHPDASDKAEIKKFYEISDAYRVLSNPEEKTAYDQTLKSGKIEKILVEEPAPHPTIYKEEKNTDDEFRKREMLSFKRKIFWSAIARVIGLGLLLAVGGYILSALLDGNRLLGAISGSVMGVIWSAFSNFDVDSFIQPERKAKKVKIISWLFFILGLVYFIQLLIRRVF
jgi:curved DNA-binding protein CbpA